MYLTKIVRNGGTVETREHKTFHIAYNYLKTRNPYIWQWMAFDYDRVSYKDIRSNIKNKSYSLVWKHSVFSAIIEKCK